MCSMYYCTFIIISDAICYFIMYLNVLMWFKGNILHHGCVTRKIINFQNPSGVGSLNISCVTQLYSKSVCNLFKHRNLSVGCRKGVAKFCFDLKKFFLLWHIFCKYIKHPFLMVTDNLNNSTISAFFCVLSIRL